MRVDERSELRSPFGHPHSSLGEGVTASGLDLDFGRDQLTDEMVLELRAGRGRLQFLEAVGQLERRRVEESELLFDGKRQVVGLFERVTRKRDLLVGCQ